MRVDEEKQSCVFDAKAAGVMIELDRPTEAFAWRRTGN